MVWGVDFGRCRKFLRGALRLAAPIAWPYFARYLRAPLLGDYQGILGLLFYTVLPSTSVIIDGSLYFMLGGVLLGVIEQLSKTYISTLWADAIVFGVLVAVLVVKPTGLLGKRISEKV